MAGNPEALKTLLFIVNESGQGDGLTVPRISDRFQDISPSEPLSGQKLRQMLRFAVECGLLRSHQGKYRLAVNICPKDLENELRMSMSRELEPGRRGPRRKIRQGMVGRPRRSPKIQMALGRPRTSTTIARRRGRNKNVTKVATPGISNVQAKK